MMKSCISKAEIPAPIRRSICRVVGVLGLVVLTSHCSTSVIAQQESVASDTFDAPASEDDLRFFENSVRPLLVSKCLECHSGADAESNLQLDSREAILLGGDSGPIIDPVQIDHSLLLEAIRYESLEMPPDEPLTEDQVAVLAEWVARGLPWPGDVTLELLRTEPIITAEDRLHWSFQPIADPELPEVANPDWCRQDIDRFILARLEANGLAPSVDADRRILLRRLSFDLIGLPPSPELMEEFLSDESDDAYERVVRKLLESPQYGERWAQMWLDLVRYADSDGYKADFARPHAWRYRDYVIRSLNDDKPYDRFVMEQLAGDEIAPEDPDALIATGFLRHWIYEFNQRDTESQWQIILDDITETTADTFLGLGFSCARCHDHKYDPILQSDYFRLQSFFNSIYARNDMMAASPAQIAEFETQRSEWEAATLDIRTRIDQLQAPHLERAEHDAVIKFPERIQQLYASDFSDRTTYENQIWHLVDMQVIEDQSKVNFESKLKDEALEEWKQLKEQLAEFDHLKPSALPMAFGVTDWSAIPAQTQIPHSAQEDVIEPGWMAVFDAPPPVITPVGENRSTGRRTELARWIANAENPLTSRVIVNRVWQQYFGRGLVETPSDFGRLGEPPSHPLLLDHLASRLVNSGWSLKQLHFDIVTSSTYRQSSSGVALEVSIDHEGSLRGDRVDPENRLLWRMNRKRLDAEQIRDAVLFVSGNLDTKQFGPAVGHDAPRRSIYLKVMRNSRHPFLEAFDYPDRISSIGRRSQTTTPNQALSMLNSDWVQSQVGELAERTTRNEAGVSDVATEFALAVRYTLGRTPSIDEITFAESFLRQQTALAESQGLEPAPARHQAWMDLCSVLINTNEFIFVD